MIALDLTKLPYFLHTELGVGDGMLDRYEEASWFSLYRVSGPSATAVWAAKRRSLVIRRVAA